LDAQSDAQHLRALIRQARKDAQAPGAKELPGQAPRHGKAYRELFQTIKTALGRDSEDTPEDEA
jgi:ribosome-associated protein